SPGGFPSTGTLSARHLARAIPSIPDHSRSARIGPGHPCPGLLFICRSTAKPSHPSPTVKAQRQKQDQTPPRDSRSYRFFARVIKRRWGGASPCPQGVVHPTPYGHPSPLSYAQNMRRCGAEKIEKRKTETEKRRCRAARGE